MSDIFDALRRSEGERTGGEPTALPKGPEILRDAERRVASQWEAVVSVSEPENEPTLTLTRESAFEPNSSMPASVSSTYVANLLSPAERTEILNRCKSLSISVAPGAHLPCITDPDSPTAEAVRLLAVRVQDLKRTRTLKKLVITSSMPREGKSTIAANLACALARRAGQRVLLVEGDLRIPVAVESFGLEPQPGICELLRESRSITDCVCRLEGAGIWILPAGISKSNPLEVLQSQKLSSVMDQLSALFDWIIIDSPPVLPLADTSIWMKIADGVLLVTRQGVTEKRLLKKGLETLEQQKLLGALLNGSKASKYTEYYYSDSGRS